MSMTKTATKLIKRFGQDAILRSMGEMITSPTVDHPNASPFSPIAGDPVDHPVTVAVTEYTIEDRQNAGIADTDLRVFMAVSDVVPNNSDTLVIGGVDYGIHAIATLGPDGVTICYDMQVRR